MFGRATIRLGIGPHSSLFVYIALALHMVSVSLHCADVIVRRWRRDASWRRIVNSCFGSDCSRLFLAAQTMRLVLHS